MTDNVLEARCCIAGGGPAGMMLGYLLARAGIDVVVLEKYPDFFRDFRGDTIHPSTMQVMDELGLLQKFLALPHDEAPRLQVHIAGQNLTVADFTHLPVAAQFLAFMPQWDFLNFIAGEAKRYRSFRLGMENEAIDIIQDRGRVTGVSAKTPDGLQAIRAELVIGADGRHSTIRAKSGLVVQDIGAPMDVLWFRLARRAGDPPQTLGTADRGRILVAIGRQNYWQCGFVIAKGRFEEVRTRGIDAFRADIASLLPWLGDRAGEIDGFERLKLLSVAVDRLVRWQRDGLLCIGDAAHAMSPVGGVGINLAIQDAVAAANILVPAFHKGVPRLSHLQAVQRRREFPVRTTQRMQVLIQNRIIRRVLEHAAPMAKLPWPLRLLQRFPVLQRIPARVVGMGFRPEHVGRGLFVEP
jgi:2-polyprenyl-6-methoxyphenol hydroxylase-like FAD-dependent oxidoreductase